MWTEKNGGLERDFQFGDFAEAWAFLTQIALAAEKMNHHPTILNTYNKVSLRLTTHDAGNQVTAKDHRLAVAIDRVFAQRA